MIDDYELLDCIGRGGMGEVWRARHRMLGRAAAIKLIRPEALGPDNGDKAQVTLRRFEKEARATAALRSPHTVELYDFGLADDGTFYYAMELLDGYDLQSLVEHHGPVEPARAVVLLRQICESLGEAHAAGLIHRDVKPANVFACRLGLAADFVKVLDFGLVKRSGTGDGDASSDTELTVDGAVPGSPAFMAPEAIRSLPVDPRTDLYALGCVAYWLLSGTRVFGKRSALELVLAHLQEEPRPLSSRVDGPLPDGLEDVVMACLAKDPDRRPDGAVALARRLAAVPFAEPWDEARADAWWDAHPAPERVALPATGEGDAGPDAVARTTPATLVSAAAAAPAAQTPDAPRANGDPPEADPPITAEWETVERDGGGAAELSSDDVVAQLQQHFDHSTIDVHEFDRRSRRAQLARSPADLRGALEGLPALAIAGARPGLAPAPEDPALPARAPSSPPAATPTPPDAGVPARAGRYAPMVAVFSATIRKGVWRPPPRMRVVAVFGGADLDFRHAQLPPGRTVVSCRCVFGGAQITVPPDLHVRVRGVGVFGGFSETGEGTAAPRDDAPWLDVTGVAVFGGVDVKIKPRDDAAPRRKALPSP